MVCSDCREERACTRFFRRRVASSPFAVFWSNSTARLRCGMRELRKDFIRQNRKIGLSRPCDRKNIHDPSGGDRREITAYRVIAFLSAWYRRDALGRAVCTVWKNETSRGWRALLRAVLRAQRLGRVPVRRQEALFAVFLGHKGAQAPMQKPSLRRGCPSSR